MVIIFHLPAGNEAILAEKRTDRNDTNNVTLETSSREGKYVNVTRPRLLTTKAICASSGGKDVNVTRRRPNKDLSNQYPVECGSNLDHDEFDLSFDTTREEMILYEKFGQDYDEIVEKMTREEKIAKKMKRKVQRKAKELEALVIKSSKIINSNSL